MALWQEYLGVVKEPRDLGTINEKLQSDEYPSISSFNKDVTLCFNNAKKYNRERNPHVYDAAVAMLKVFQSKIQNLIEDAVHDKAKSNTTNPKVKIKKSKSKSEQQSGTPFAIGKAETIMKTLSSLKSAQWFNEPIDTNLTHYLDRIASPLDFVKIKGKMNSKKYQSMEEFALDIRRCMGNSLVYNYQVVHFDSSLKKNVQAIRRDTKVVLFRFEEEWFRLYEGVSPALPELKDVLAAIEEGMKIMSKSNPGVAAIESFINPVAFYYVNNHDHMATYNAVISQPMDYGSIMSKLIEAQYESTEEVLNDCRLVADNACKFYASQQNVSEHTAKSDDALTVDAFRLLEKIERELDKLRSKRRLSVPPLTTTISSSKELEPSTSDSGRKPALSLKISSKNSARQSGKPITDTTMKKRTPFNFKEKCLWCINELKEHKLENGIITSHPFLKAVDTNIYTDYFQVVHEAMDLSLMEKKINRDRYPDMLSIWKDMELLRDNCHTYAQFKGFEDVIYLADLTADIFRYLLKLVAEEVQEMDRERGDSMLDALLPSEDCRKTILEFDAPVGIVNFYDDLFKRRSLEAEERHAAEKVAAERAREKAVAPKVATVVNDNKKPLKLSFKQPPPQSVAADAQVPHDDEYDENLEHTGELDLDQYEPVQLPLPAKRIASKGSAAKKQVLLTSAELEPWEIACYDLLKKISKHEFIDTTKTKIGVVVMDFYHPVVELYPEISEAYLDAVSQPMDLSTIYRRLEIRGFLDAEDVFLKILLIFQNCVTYNSPAMDDNEYLKSVVLRCKHMIKYVTWLAHEMLPCADDIEKNEPEREAMGQLRKSLRNIYRQDRLEVIENQPIFSGGKECYALIKKFELRKYNKEMSYFI